MGQDGAVVGGADVKGDLGFGADVSATGVVGCGASGDGLRGAGRGVEGAGCGDGWWGGGGCCQAAAGAGDALWGEGGLDGDVRGGKKGEERVSSRRGRKWQCRLVQSSYCFKGG